jgi:hypothetical protein
MVLQSKTAMLTIARTIMPPLAELIISSPRSAKFLIRPIYCSYSGLYPLCVLLHRGRFLPPDFIFTWDFFAFPQDWQQHSCATVLETQQS